MKYEKGIAPYLSLAESFDFLGSAVLSVHKFDTGTDFFTHTSVLDSNHLINREENTTHKVHEHTLSGVTYKVSVVS